MKDNKLEVGDIVFCYHHGYPGYYSRHTINRLTPKRAILDNGDQVVNDLQTRYYASEELVAKGVGDSSDARLSTKELERSYQEQQIRRKATTIYQSINMKQLPIDKCQALIDLFPAPIKTNL